MCIRDRVYTPIPCILKSDKYCFQCFFIHIGSKNDIDVSLDVYKRQSFFSREAEHVAGFAKECAVVTHYRLRSTEDGTEVEVDPNAKLDDCLLYTSRCV